MRCLPDRLAALTLLAAAGRGRCGFAMANLITFANLRCCAAITALLALSHCGSEPESSAAAAATGPTSLRTAQEPLPQACTDKITACWATEVSKNAALGTVAAAIAQPFQAAGFVTDADGNRLVWAEFAPSPTAARADIAVAWGLCKQGNTACTAGTASYTPTGAKIVDANGKDVARIGIGLPVLRKAIKFHSPDKDPSLLAPLTQGNKLDAASAKAILQTVKPATRRMVILNAYGPQVGCSADSLVAAASKTGLFDSVEVIDFARIDDVVAILPALTPLDAVVWIGAGVQEKFTDKPEKPLGMTVSRGVFGDTLVHGKTLTAMLDAPPLGGPGLIVLAGSNTLATGYFSDKSTLGDALDGQPSRAVVGFGGKVTPDQALGAAATLLIKLAAGVDLEAALAATGQPVLSPMDKAARSKWLWAPKKAAFWGGKPPSKAAMTLHVSMDPPVCADPIDPCDLTSWKDAVVQNKVPSDKVTASQASFICNGLKFDGPFFSCQAKDDNSKADFTLQGVMRGHAIGDRFWVTAHGSANMKYRQMLVIGEGTIASSDAGGGKTSLPFKGIAAASPYIDQDGNCCAVGSPMLTTIKNEPGIIEIWP